MKKKFFILALSALFCMGANAQLENDDYGCFKHLSAGLSIGTQGVGIEAGTDLTKWAGVRADIAFMPGFKIKGDCDVDDVSDNSTYRMDVEGSLARTSIDLLVDFYPTDWFSVTAGFGFAGQVLGEVKGYSEELEAKNKTQVKIDDYVVDVNKGHMKGGVKVSGFRPYLGIGFGCRQVPKNRVGYHVDLGVFFHGKPKVYEGSTSNVINPEYTYDKGEFHDVMSKLTVYPQLKFTVRGRIF